MFLWISFFKPVLCFFKYWTYEKIIRKEKKEIKKKA